MDSCVENYKGLETEEQILFKSSAKRFVRTYNFLSAILPYGSVDWEKLSIFLNLLINKLPSPNNEDDLSEGILESVDLESYRVVAQETMSITLADENVEIDPVPVSTDVGIHVPELDTLTHILQTFHDIWGDCDWTDEDRIRRQVADLPDIVSRDEAYQNAMKFSDAQNARDESDRATIEAIMNTISTGMELYEAFESDKRNKNNQSFKKWLLDMVFNATYRPKTHKDQSLENIEKE